MLLNRVEYLLMNNPLRAAIQRPFEARRLLKMGGQVPGGCVLEIGCGRGVGTELTFGLFGATRVDALDLDPRMVRLAQRRTRRYGDRVRIWEGDVTAIAVPDNRYDAVFDPRDRRCRIANRAMRMVYQLVAGRHVWRGKGVNRESLLAKLQEFHRLHKTPLDPLLLRLGVSIEDGKIGYVRSSEL